jgi:hypothetical protein
MGKIGFKEVFYEETTRMSPLVRIYQNIHEGVR